MSSRVKAEGQGPSESHQAITLHVGEQLEEDMRLRILRMEVPQYMRDLGMSKPKRLQVWVHEKQKYHSLPTGNYAYKK